MISVLKLFPVIQNVNVKILFTTQVKSLEIRGLFILLQRQR